jgi:hypothetical protein
MEGVGYRKHKSLLWQVLQNSDSGLQEALHEAHMWENCPVPKSQENIFWILSSAVRPTHFSQRF